MTRTAVAAQVNSNVDCGNVYTKVIIDSITGNTQSSLAPPLVYKGEQSPETEGGGLITNFLLQQVPMAAIAITRSENLSSREKTPFERRATTINGEEEKQTPPSATANRGTPTRRSDSKNIKC